jgi:hypothetical protein
MNNVMRTLGGALGGQLSATFIADHMVKNLPAVTGFTETFLMATGFLLLCFGAGLLVPPTTRVPPCPPNGSPRVSPARAAVG